MVQLYEKDADNALILAMEDGKKHGRLSEDETIEFIQNLGK